MESNELRLGNLVNYEQTTHKIVSLSEDHCMSVWVSDSPFKDRFIHNYSELKLILLTEEWLLKFGLLKTNKLSFSLGCYELVWAKGIECWNVILKNGIVARVISVHQLQNLYFALTNKELTY